MFKILRILGLTVSLLFGTVPLVTTNANAASTQGHKGLAATYDLPVPKRLTPFLHPVIYASPDVNVKQVAGKTVIRQILIIKWGLHVFEVVEGLYQCTGSPATSYTCEWVDHTRLVSYSSCDVSSSKPKCIGKISGNSGPMEDIDAGWDPELERYVPDDLAEFPDREHDPENPVP